MHYQSFKNGVFFVRIGGRQCATLHIVVASPSPFRTMWTRSWIDRRQRHGVNANLLNELDTEDPEIFRPYHRLNVVSFKTILEIVGPRIQKQEQRPSNRGAWLIMTAVSVGKLLWQLGTTSVLKCSQDRLQQQRQQMKSTTWQHLMCWLWRSTL